MSRKPLQLKPIRKFEEDDLKFNTDRPAYQTDKLVEESINIDLSFSKEDSYSLSNLKHDWDSIKLLQNDIKKTSEKLKQLGSIHSRPLSECGKIGKSEKKSKIENASLKELKALQEKCSELSLIVTKYEKEKQDLLSANFQLREELSQSTDLNSQLKKQLSNYISASSSKKTSEIMKYGQFITKKIKELPKWEELFMDRVSSISSFLNLIKLQKFEDLLLNTFQFISDIMVHCIKDENSRSNSPVMYLKEPEKVLNDDSENLLQTINAQSERIEKLNKQISEAMISSKELLYSPLAQVVKKENRGSKSICLTPVSSTFKKPLFSTPERWRLKREIIQETNVDEEVSGKPF